MMDTRANSSDMEQVATVRSADADEDLLQPASEVTVKVETVSIHTVGSETSSLQKDQNAIGRPSKCRRFKVLDCIAVACSMICLVVSIVVVLPVFTVSWHMGFQAQIITIGFLIGIMNLCAERVVPACFLSVEARYGRSRLQNYDAILTTKFLSSHISFYWRTALVLFLALPLALSVGYKQFLGGFSTASLKPLLGMYGITFPVIGDWTPIPDPIYLQISSNAAFHTASSTDAPLLNGSEHYPRPYGYNALLLSNESAAMLDLPENNYLRTIRSKLKDGETWQISVSVNAYVATRQHDNVDKLRTDDKYWESALNSSVRGLISYYLVQDANSYIGMLAISYEPVCWMGVFRGGPPTDSMYSKSTNDANVVGFRKTAELFSMSRQRCQATWEISNSSLVLVSGICDEHSDAIISQEPVLNAPNTPWMIEGGPDLPHIFWTFVVVRPNSTWLMPTYAITAATSYWARAVYEIVRNPGSIRPVFNYTGIDEKIQSTRETLNPAPGLFLILAVQPALTLLAFLIKSFLSMPLGTNFGLISVLAGIKRPALDALGGAGFSGELQRPLKLELSLTEQGSHGARDLGGLAVRAVRYELKAERTGKKRRKGTEKYVVPKADTETLYV